MKRDNVEQQRVRGRNHQEVVQQLVETYNSGNGWALVRVAANPITMEVFLERNANQVGGLNEETQEVVSTVQKKEDVSPQEKTTEEEKPTKNKGTTQTKSSSKEEDAEEASEDVTTKKRATTKKPASK